MGADRSKLFGTEFEDGLNLDLDYSLNISKKRSKPKEISSKPKEALRVSIDDKVNRGLKTLTPIDWVEYYAKKCKEHGYIYTKTSKISSKRELTIISDMMKELSPDDLKGVIDFAWDVWDNPKVTKSTMRITIFDTGWAHEIYNSYIEFKKGNYKTYAQKSLETNSVVRGCKSEETKDEKIVIGKGVFI